MYDSAWGCAMGRVCPPPSRLSMIIDLPAAAEGSMFAEAAARAMPTAAPVRMAARLSFLIVVLLLTTELLCGREHDAGE
ncbi:hypothetical protein [Streptomyces griseocarneus]|uniref:Uncharacterized protein n=1 Tax=Streptomyces griseocarneus TaxID=51201 RepID=A0ABX7RP89_9ACTN|nr:hypothetical protein [Streptomyces griseocarneus]QSY49597.1 hypothetical protein J3S04_00105 [Streptomyces griseocarneus]